MALIRSNFSVDPTRLDDEEFARLFNEALWLEGWRLRNQAEMIANVFGGK